MNYIFLGIALSASVAQSYPNHANTLGRTHFVVGMPQTAYMQYEESPANASLSSVGEHKIFFAPDDDIHAELITLITNEPTSIKMAMYLFTDKEVAQALHDAKKRGVRIECVTDATCIANKFNKFDALMHQDVPVWVYRAGNDKQGLGNAMHHKFMIFGTSCKVVTGSLNVTHSAQKSNQENIVILGDAYSVKKFDTQFEVLKKRCSQLMPQKKSGIAK